MTEHGFGTKMDDASAFLFYQVAAWGQDPNAQMVLGYRYAVGVGVKKDCDTALRHYKPIATQGNYIHQQRFFPWPSFVLTLSVSRVVQSC